MTPKTKEDRINTVMGGGRHVVILGAGASIASTLRNPESNGKKLPSMDNFISTVGLEDIVDSLPKKLRAANFENLYSKLYNFNSDSIEIREIERRVYNYFKDMRLPDEPTIYDYLVLALRSKDLIATFNWDPFLYQAFNRNHHIVEMPLLSFPHGNVAIGFNKGEMRAGPAGGIHKISGNHYDPTRLLFPVTNKNYTSDAFINQEWDRLKLWLNDNHTKWVTIFGYGAPVTDVEAMKLLNEAWGTSDKRNMEQFEIIDIRDEADIKKAWSSFIYSGHDDYSTSYFNSSLSINPRRVCEWYFEHMEPTTIEEALSESNPIPDNLSTLKELWEWHEPLIAAEKKWLKGKTKSPAL